MRLGFHVLLHKVIHMTNSTYVTQRKNTYYFRYRIPTDLHHIIYRKELLLPLKTQKYSSAILIAEKLVDFLKSQFKDIRLSLFKNDIDKLNTILNRRVKVMNPENGKISH